MNILVTGATGKLGTKVVETLLKSVPAHQLAVSVRQPEKAEHLRARGVDVRHGDFDRPETLETAFQGIDRLLIISTDGDNETRIRQHTNAVNAAQRAQVGFIAYTSLANANESRLALAEVHRVTEEAIANTGIPYSFLRNNWYLENEIGTVQAVLAGAPWVTSAGTGKVGWALRQDYAEAAAAVLAGDGHENTIYELSGPLMTQEELAAALGAVLGKDVPVQQVNDAAYADIMKKAGLPDPLVSFLVDIQRGIREGSLEIESNDFEKLLGRPVTPIHDALAQLVRDLKGTTH
ncbi:NmrA [Geobacillus thermoleovorans CCB_US3_UF5]|jgi:NAD(P)H dehydrogenase (quinone)|uniref:SDR family NAD(P)-dependent oxidoreductase n=5 Tax=Geobacillus thermoleovorans group TaxID=1505648 RepID=A0A1C3D4S8_GEOTH|nr:MULTISPECIES: SDR family oxidoreductase [Geobacillus]AEV17779.1 NmrA [Geobacillus thermoleovorans CCB_US3_UF5]AOL33328.1 NAD(P)-dependent oxidoreductase [Geobacillus thermoleovorans]AUI36530.1 NAD(P)-dependent oxidoreductase [[Bacillus] caldolyticus]AWO74045.1 SDR family NAD(P)-dependent oxidoreductase [Geobacillus thermoleovorans]EQB95356.1 NmrA [Geobacillus sp. A8]